MVYVELVTFSPTSSTPNMGLLSWLSWTPRRGSGTVNHTDKKLKVKRPIQESSSLESKDSATTSSLSEVVPVSRVRAKLSTRKKGAANTRKIPVKKNNLKRNGDRRKKPDISPRKSESASDADTDGKLPIKRVKSLWKVRPLPVDEKLKIFIEGRDDSCAKYDGGDFYQWLQDCKAGRADPMEAGAYPLVIQDSDLRLLLEIKNPSDNAIETISLQLDKNHKTKKNQKKKDLSKSDLSGIRVPSWNQLNCKDWPEAILCGHEIPILMRNPGGDAVNIKIISQKRKNQSDDDIEPAYMRYMQPTPDDLDQAIEYDLDEEDEKWLEKYNKKHKNLNEEWMEHLMDRMEKEYTSELQKHPEKWILKKEQDDESGQDQIKGGEGCVKGIIGAMPPPLILPPISEMFPLSKCLQARGLNFDETTVRDVYYYWKKKHQKSGRPLIQRLWYEPPWHRKATDTTTKTAENEDVFAGYDVPSTLSRIRKRKMNDTEVQSRFDCMRRDLEMVRTIADLVRRREKLKKQETVLLKAEWASRMQDIASGMVVSTTRGQLKSRPPKLSSLIESKRKPPQQTRSSPMKKLALERATNEDRAARLAARRNIRAEALASKSGIVKRPKRSVRRKCTPRTSVKRSSKSSSGQPRSRTGQFLSFDKIQNS